MSILSTADFFAAARFLRLLTMPYEKTAAYKEGVIDNKGKLLLPMKEMNQKQKESYTVFHRLVFNLRRLLQKVPVFGNNILLNYASALMLIREHVLLFKGDETLILNALNEKFSLDENMSSDLHGLHIGHQYELNKDLLHENTFEPIYKEGTKVKIVSLSEYAIYNIPFYVAKHSITGHKILVCEGDLKNVEKMIKTEDASVTPTVTTNAVGNVDIALKRLENKKKKKKELEELKDDEQDV